MAKRKENGAVEMHLRFYPEKYEAHRTLVEQIRRYQETMGVGPSDALAAMLYPMVKEQEGRERRVELPEESAAAAEAEDVGSTIPGADSDFFFGSL